MIKPEFNPHLFSSPTSFREMPVSVYADFLICHKKDGMKRYLEVQSGNNSSISCQLSLRISAFVARNTITRRADACYNPHRKVSLIPYHRPAAPQSDFALRA